MRSPLEFFTLGLHPQTLQCEGLRSDPGICIFSKLPRWSSWALGFGNPCTVAFLYHCVESCAFLLNHKTRPQLLQVTEGPSLPWPWPSSFNSFHFSLQHQKAIHCPAWTLLPCHSGMVAFLGKVKYPPFSWHWTHSTVSVLFSSSQFDYTSSIEYTYTVSYVYVLQSPA